MTVWRSISTRSCAISGRWRVDALAVRRTSGGRTTDDGQPMKQPAGRDSCEEASAMDAAISAARRGRIARAHPISPVQRRAHLGRAAILAAGGAALALFGEHRERHPRRAVGARTVVGGAGNVAPRPHRDRPSDLPSAPRTHVRHGAIVGVAGLPARPGRVRARRDARCPWSRASRGWWASRYASVTYRRRRPATSSVTPACTGDGGITGRYERQVGRRKAVSRSPAG